MNKEIGIKEFIALMAFIMSIVAMSIDAMLPALGQMTTDLGIQNANDIQLVISFVFLGTKAGNMY